MFRWIPYAMVRVTFFFVAGISAAIVRPGVFTNAWLYATIACYLILFCFKKRWALTGAVGLSAIFLLGYVRVEIHTDRNNPAHFIHHTPSDFYKVRVTRYAEEKENSWKMEASVISVCSSKQWTPKTGRIVLYFSKKDFARPYQYGDVMVIRGSPSIVRPPSNPGEFDLQRNLYFKNIYHQHYIRAGQVKLVGKDNGNPFISTAIDVRLWADRQLKTYVKGEREQATASALVLGVTDGLDNDLLQAYASTGAMHVLAVSGLHVSIIYWIILLLGKPIEKMKSGKAVLAILSVVLLWIYAFVTGWSPSVLRAVMMFTFVALARPWKQSTNIYNTMASSAFCLLVYDPFFLMSVGFQLSYIAVFGIVFIHPHLYVLWEPKSRFWDETWKVTSVSIAAQIATIPMSLYYFHQFPNYFLLANLLVIPASFVVLVVGLAVLPLAIVPFLASIVGFVLQWVIYLMNSIVIIIGSLPFAVVGNIYIDGLQGLLLAGITLGVLFCLILKNIRWLWMSLMFAVAFSAFDWAHLSLVKRDHITVYNVGGATAIDLMSGGKLCTYGEVDPKGVQFHIAANRVRLGVTSIEPARHHAKQGNTLIVWRGMKILVVTSHPAGNIIADITIISNNSVKSLESIKSKIVVIDSSNSFYFASRLLRQPVPKGMEIHSVAHNGAFQYSF